LLIFNARRSPIPLHLDSIPSPKATEKTGYRRLEDHDGWLEHTYHWFAGLNIEQLDTLNAATLISQTCWNWLEATLAATGLINEIEQVPDASPGW